MQIQIGKGIDLSVDLDKLGMVENELTNPVARHVVYIGLRNILMDAHASITTDEPDYQAKARAVAEKKLDALYSGEVRVAGTREGDPVRAEAIRLATAQVDAALRASGRKPSKVDASKKREAVLKLVPGLMEKAAARVAEAKALQGDVDVSGL